MKKKGLSVKAICEMAVADKTKRLVIYDNCFDGMMLTIYDKDDKFFASSVRFKKVSLLKNNIPNTYKKYIERVCY